MSRLDPVTLEVLRNALPAIAADMAVDLQRASYNMMIYEVQDFCCALLDADGRELCESESTPMHIGSLPWYIRGFLHRIDKNELINDPSTLVEVKPAGKPVSEAVHRHLKSRKRRHPPRSWSCRWTGAASARERSGPS